MTMQEIRPMPLGGISINELLADLEGRLTYRQIDYWIRTGAVRLRNGGHGSGSRRAVMPDERLAIIALVDEYEKMEADKQYLRSGELFLELLGWNDLTPHTQAG